MFRLLISLLFMISVPAFGQYMSMDQILEEYNRVEIKAKVFKPSAQYKENVARLTPADKFKPKTKPAPFVYDIKEGTVPDGVDLRGRDTSIKNQGSYGYCTAFALTSIVENMINFKSTKAGLNLSDWHAWSYYKEYQMDAAIKALSANKICDEVYYPQGGKLSDKCVANKHAMVTSYKQISQAAVTQTLANGRPVYFGLAVPRGMANCEKVIKDLTVTSGGHAVQISGYITDEMTGDVLYLIKNSWGTGCADKGYTYLPAKYCAKTWCYFYDVQSVASKYDNVVPPPPNPPEKVCVKWQRKWYAPWKKYCVEWK